MGEDKEIKVTIGPVRYCTGYAGGEIESLDPEIKKLNSGHIPFEMGEVIFDENRRNTISAQLRSPGNLLTKLMKKQGHKK